MSNEDEALGAEIDAIMNELENLQNSLESQSEEKKDTPQKVQAKTEDKVETKKTEEPKQVETKKQDDDFDEMFNEAIAIVDQETNSAPQLKEAKKETPKPTQAKAQETQEKQVETTVSKNESTSAETSLLDQAIEMESEEPQNIIPIRSSVVSGSKLSLNVSGELSLQIAFESEGSSIEVGVSNGHFVVKMPGGVEFKMPVSEKKSAKKTA